MSIFQYTKKTNSLKCGDAIFKRSALGAAIFSVALLVGCGGGGSSDNSSNTDNTLVPQSDINVSGAVVKGPLSGATVSVYVLDYSQLDLKGELVTSGVTDAMGGLSDILVPGGFVSDQPLLIEYVGGLEADDSEPVITPLRTIITRDQLVLRESIYATPLSTVAVELARLSLEGRAQVSSAVFEAALLAQQTVVIDNLSLGLIRDLRVAEGDNISPYTASIFNTSPIASADQDEDEKALALAFRTANEALAISSVILGGDAAGYVKDLARDLTDGELDGMAGDEGLPEVVGLRGLIADAAAVTAFFANPIPGAGGVPLSQLGQYMQAESGLDTPPPATVDACVFGDACEVETYSFTGKVVFDLTLDEVIFTVNGASAPITSGGGGKLTLTLEDNRLITGSFSQDAFEIDLSSYFGLTVEGFERTNQLDNLTNLVSKANGLKFSYQVGSDAIDSNDAGSYEAVAPGNRCTDLPTPDDLCGSIPASSAFDSIELKLNHLFAGGGFHNSSQLILRERGASNSTYYTYLLSNAVIISGGFDPDRSFTGSNPYPGDLDGDGVLDDEDNCPSDVNPGQEDTYGVVGVGDACELITYNAEFEATLVEVRVIIEGGDAGTAVIAAVGGGAVPTATLEAEINNFELSRGLLTVPPFELTYDGSDTGLDANGATHGDDLQVVVTTSLRVDELAATSEAVISSVGTPNFVFGGGNIESLGGGGTGKSTYTMGTATDPGFASQFNTPPENGEAPIIGGDNTNDATVLLSGGVNTCVGAGDCASINPVSSNYDSVRLIYFNTDPAGGSAGDGRLVVTEKTADVTIEYRYNIVRTVTP